MLENLTFNGRELLLAIVLATLVYLLEVWLFSGRRKSAQASRLEARIRHLEESFVQVEERLAALEKGAISTHDQADTYAEAVRLANDGMSAKEITQQLAISLTEAELIIALKRAGP